MKEVLASFGVQFFYDHAWHDAFIKTCCKEDDMFYYDVWINDQFQFSLTKNENVTIGEVGEWNVSLANADNNIDPRLAEAIGLAIDRYLQN